MVMILPANKFYTAGVQKNIYLEMALKGSILMVFFTIEKALFVYMSP